jgi:Tol biopolymer transport system component
MRAGARGAMEASVVALVFSLLVVPGAPVFATFPGQNGLIVYQHEEPAGDHTQTDMFTVMPDGSGMERLTNSPDRNEFDPAWNARGTRIAFWRTKAPFGPGNLWVMDADGSDQRRLTKGVDARNPSWSPAGDRLVYNQLSDGTSDLFTLRVSDGGGRRHLTSGPAEDFEPAWSPNGRFVAFTRAFATGDAGDIYLLDRRTGHVTQVTDSIGYDHQVGWSPGGNKLVFERDFNRRFAICSVHPNGTGLRILTGGRHFDISPAFSPNGQRIVFGSDRPGEGFHDLWVMHADGTNKHRLLEQEFAEGFPDWQAA